MDDDDIEYYGPCAHCGTVLWLLPHHQVAPEAASDAHGFELPDAIGWLAVADDLGWSCCPICSCAISIAPVSLN
jgi:hypothetical protein